MSDGSNIEWTDATWNPTTGCTKVSPGCANCYIERTPAFRIAGRKFDAKAHIPLQRHENRLEQPLHWRKPRRVFVNSLSDLFHNDVPDDFIDQVFAVMALCPRHTFQVLTKRPERMRAYVTADFRANRVFDAMRALTPSAGVWAWPTWAEAMRHVWLGVSVENQHFADERIPLLLQTPAAVRFLSCEPLLGHLNVAQFLSANYISQGGRQWIGAGGIGWVIVGVEKLAGRNAGRNADAYEARARSILFQCASAGIAAFHKQMPVRGRVSGDPTEWPADLRVREFPPAPRQETQPAADDLTDEALLALGAIAREHDTREAQLAAMRRFLAGGVWQTVRGGARRT